jgi:hypothetical protein
MIPPKTIEQKIDALVQNDIYRQLPTTKRKFVRAMIETGDKKKAGYATSDKLSSDRAALRVAYRCLKDPVVVAVLKTFGQNPQDPPLSDKELMRLVSARLRQEGLGTTDFLRLVELHQSLKKTGKKPPTIEAMVLEAEQRNA